MDIFENFTVSILKLNKLVQKIKVYEMHGYGLKAIHVMCVYYLSCHKEGLTAGELVKLTLEDKAAISRALKVLQQKGYLSYDGNKYNAVIRLTDEGNKLARFIEERSDKAVRACSADLTDEERVLFYRSLGSIAEKLGKYYENLGKNEGEHND